MCYSRDAAFQHSTADRCVTFTEEATNGGATAPLADGTIVTKCDVSMRRVSDAKSAPPTTRCRASAATHTRQHREVLRPQEHTTASVRHGSPPQLQALLPMALHFCADHMRHTFLGPGEGVRDASDLILSRQIQNGAKLQEQKTEKKWVWQAQTGMNLGSQPAHCVPARGKGDR